MEPRDLVSPVACPRLVETSNPVIMCALTEENVELTKDFFGPWDLSYQDSWRRY